MAGARTNEQDQGRTSVESVVEALLALALMLAGAGIGSALRRALPDSHLDEHAKDVVRLGAALVATITALVLSLLINSANSFFEAQRAEVRQIASDVILLDAMLDNYGPEARQARGLLRTAIEGFIEQVWRGAEPAPDTSPLGTHSHDMFNAIANLPATTPLQHILQGKALETAIRIAQSRLALYERARSRLPAPILYVLMFWLTTLFASFSLFTPLNPTSSVALTLVALCAAAALFLILEMQRPFTGFMNVPASTLTSAMLPIR